MNCDQAFELIGNPDAPSAVTGGAEFESHLANCPRCRQLQDVLSPLWAEPAEAERTGYVPENWTARAAQERANEGATVARAAARSLNVAHQRRRLVGLTAILLSYAAVFFIGAGGFWLAGLNGPTNAADGILPSGCTRGMARSSVEPRGLVLTCVSCHLDRKTGP